MSNEAVFYLREGKDGVLEQGECPAAIPLEDWMCEEDLGCRQMVRMKVRSQQGEMRLCTVILAAGGLVYVRGSDLVKLQQKRWLRLVR